MENQSYPQIALSDEEIQSCFAVISELRTHLKADRFLETIKHMQAEGFQLAYIKHQQEVVAAAGFRICTNLFMGKHLYVDDLITANKHRSKGYGAQLIQWLRQQAVEADCNFFHLDSGTHRGRAHKFYFEQGLTIASYHFSEQLNG